MECPAPTVLASPHNVRNPSRPAISRPSTFFCAFLTLLNDRLGESIVFPLLPFLLASFTGDGRVLGLLAGSYAVAQFAFTPLIGALSDRFGRKPVISICVAGSVLGLALFALTVSLPWRSLWPAADAAGLPLALLFTARLIDGVSGGTAATASAVLADISPPEKRAKAFGLIGVAFGLGFILGPALGGLLGQINVTLPLVLAVAIAALNLVLVLTLLPETHPPEARSPLPRRRDLHPFGQLAKVFAQTRVRRLCAAFFLFFLGFSGFTALLVLYFKQAFGWGPGLAGGAFLVVGVVATVVQGGVIGPLVKRLGEWRLSLGGLGFVIVGCLLVAFAQAGNATLLVFNGLDNGRLLKKRDQPCAVSAANHVMPRLAGLLIDEKFIVIDIAHDRATRYSVNIERISAADGYSRQLFQGFKQCDLCIGWRASERDRRNGMSIIGCV